MNAPWEARHALGDLMPEPTPVCLYCWPVLTAGDALNVVHDPDGLPCCQQHRFESARPALPSFMWSR